MQLPTGATLAWSTAGAPGGRPVLFVHAWAESPRAFERVLPHLPRSRRAVLPDLRGHGDSDKPSDCYALDEVADEVAAFMDAVGLGAAVLVGSSSGGYLAQQVAVSHPDRVTGPGAGRCTTEPVGPATVRRRGRGTHRSRGCDVGPGVARLVRPLPPRAAVVRPGPGWSSRSGWQPPSAFAEDR